MNIFAEYQKERIKKKVVKKAVFSHNDEFSGIEQLEEELNEVLLYACSAVFLSAIVGALIIAL